MAVAIVADNQIRIAEQLENEAAAINLGWMDQIQELELGKKLSLIMNSTDLRQTLSREAARICDGVGAERVAKEMLK
jgi:spore coat polysaccharide biosynthesis predicted glycosyltransferase SpsG